MKSRKIILCCVLVTWATLSACQEANKINKDNWKRTFKGPMMNKGCGKAECDFIDHAYLHGFCGGELTDFMADVQDHLMGTCNISDACSRPGTPDMPEKNVFDFIVVGAGAAGPVLARRLSDNEDYSVLLLEAGPEEPTIASVPGFAFHSIGSDVDWQYKTMKRIKPTFCRDSHGVCSWPRGKMISGSAGMNGMMYIRGHPSIYDQWADKGNPGWCYAEVEKYFELAENRRNQVTRKNGKSRQSRKRKDPIKHPLILDKFNHRPPFANDILKAAGELGYKIEGITPAVDEGVVIPDSVTKDGMRNSPAKAYLRPVAERENLNVMTGVHVSRVLTKPDARTGKPIAYGVEVIDQSGKRSKFEALKEVILSAGAIGSPQILLLSGIGPKKDLEKLNIPVVKDLPAVGKNLQNHVSIGIGMVIEADNHQPLTSETLDEFMQNRTGPLASTGLSQVTAFFRSNYSENGVPDIQSFFDGFPLGCPKTGSRNECIDGKDEKCPARHHITARPTVGVTRSRGYLKLRTNHPLDHPKIYPKYFDDPRDMKILIEGIHKILNFANAPTMRGLKMKVDDKPHPSCSGYKFGTDKYWECFIRADTGPENHQVGTCTMGPEDRHSVVNHKLKVHGVGNLRVADASIFPVITNANTMSPTVMVAEKAADMISKEWAQNTVSNPPGPINRHQSQQPDPLSRFPHNVDDLIMPMTPLFRPASGGPFMHGFDHSSDGPKMSLPGLHQHQQPGNFPSKFPRISDDSIVFPSHSRPMSGDPVMPGFDHGSNGHRMPPSALPQQHLSPQGSQPGYLHETPDQFWSPPRNSPLNFGKMSFPPNSGSKPGRYY